MKTKAMFDLEMRHQDMRMKVEEAMKTGDLALTATWLIKFTLIMWDSFKIVAKQDQQSYWPGEVGRKLAEDTSGAVSDHQRRLFSLLVSLAKAEKNDSKLASKMYKLAQKCKDELPEALIFTARLAIDADDYSQSSFVVSASQVPYDMAWQYALEYLDLVGGDDKVPAAVLWELAYYGTQTGHIREARKYIDWYHAVAPQWHYQRLVSSNTEHMVKLLEKSRPPNNTIGGPGPGPGPGPSRRCAACDKQNPGVKACSGCNRAYFCNKKCQREAWKGHKKMCRRISEYMASPKKGKRLFKVQIPLRGPQGGDDCYIYDKTRKHKAFQSPAQLGDEVIAQIQEWGHAGMKGYFYGQKLKGRGIVIDPIMAYSLQDW